MTSLGDFSATSINGARSTSSDYQGQVVLVVNAASKCGFTPQYEGLEKLCDSTRRPRGARLPVRPVRSPGARRRGRDPEFCERTYGVTFPMFAKVEVNGDDAHPLYQWLRTRRAACSATHQVELHQVPGRPRRQRRQALRLDHQAREDHGRHRGRTSRASTQATLARDHGHPDRVAGMAATPSSYSITMRLHTAPDHGVVGAVATAIAQRRRHRHRDRRRRVQPRPAGRRRHLLGHRLRPRRGAGRGGRGGRRASRCTRSATAPSCCTSAARSRSPPRCR